jgi:hypothetical protein
VTPAKPITAAEALRLARQALEDDARMTPGPWLVDPQPRIGVVWILGGDQIMARVGNCAEASAIQLTVGQKSSQAVPFYSIGVPVPR